MYKIRPFRYGSSELPVTIVGCPSSGLAAIDFRKAHGLPQAPSDHIDIELDQRCESVCREYPELLDENADLVIETLYGSLVPSWSTMSYLSSGLGGRVNVPAPIIAAYLAGPVPADPLAGLADLVDAIVDDATTRVAAARAEAEAKAVAEAEAKAAAKAEAEAKVLALWYAGKLYVQGSKGIMKLQEEP